MSFLHDFKEFAVRGNVIDLSEGVIIGASFNKIVDVFVQGILMPPLGYVTGGINLPNKRLILKPAVVDAAGKIIQPENAIRYGELVQATIIFTITALAVFLLIKAINVIHRRHAAQPAKDMAIPPQEKLLIEIRDVLKESCRPGR